MARRRLPKQRDLGGEELLDGLGGRRPAAVHARQDAVQRFESPGQLEVGELGRDAFPARGPLHDTPPAILAYSASGRRSTSTIRGVAVSGACEASCSDTGAASDR